METKFEHPKLEWCKNELKALLERLMANNYHASAQVVFDNLAHTGMETDLNKELKEKPTMEEFLASK